MGPYALLGTPACRGGGGEHRGEGEQASSLGPGEVEGCLEGVALAGPQVRGLGCAGRAFGEWERVVPRPGDVAVARCGAGRRGAVTRTCGRCRGRGRRRALWAVQAQAEILGGLPSGLEGGPQAERSLMCPFAAPRAVDAAESLPPEEELEGERAARPPWPTWRSSRRAGCTSEVSAQGWPGASGV